MARPKNQQPAAQPKTGKTVRVYSRLPYGLIIQVGRARAEIAGLNSSAILGATVMATEIDAELWAEFARINAKSRLITSGAVFAERNDKSAAARAEDSDKTRLEPADPAESAVEAMTGD